MAEILRKFCRLFNLKQSPGEVQCTMISEVKLRRVLKNPKLATARLDWIISKKPSFLDVSKKKSEREVAEVDFRKLDTFHNAVRPIMVIAQWFACMPVAGVMSLNPKDTRFTLRCPQTAYAILYILLGVFFMFVALKRLFEIGINPKNLIGVSFFTCVLFANILFFSLAQRWPNIIQHWSRVEMVFLKEPYIKPRRTLAARVQTAAFVLMIFSAVEHFMHHVSYTYAYCKQVSLCNQTEAGTFSHYLEEKFDYIYDVVPFNTEIGVVFLIVLFAFTFTWNYMDIFIMMVSKGIAYRFEQITVRIKNLSGEEIPECVFTEIREHYVRLCELLECVDENLSGIILLSSINNLYFVCSQLLNIFNKLRWPVNYLYFWYSLLYLMGRAVFVLLAAASINDQSKAPVSMLRRVSQKTWCIEVERLIYQMTTQTVALSGKKFYFLTRRLVFGMAGTIVTYELVLLQFDEPNRSKGLPDLCD